MSQRPRARPPWLSRFSVDDAVDANIYSSRRSNRNSGIEAGQGSRLAIWFAGESIVRGEVVDEDKGQLVGEVAGLERAPFLAAESEVTHAKVSGYCRSAQPKGLIAVALLQAGDERHVGRGFTNNILVALVKEGNEGAGACCLAGAQLGQCS